MLSRTPEPEVMDSADEAAEYDAMDHSAVNSVFVDDFVDAVMSAVEGSVLDVGTGTAQIPILAATRFPDVSITAVDASLPMLTRAEENVLEAGVSDRVTIDYADACFLSTSTQSCDAVMSNSLIHHLPDDDAVVRALLEMRRVLRSGGTLFLRDLCRPESSGVVESLVVQYAGNETPTAQQLFRQSLHAAWTVAEMRTFLHRAHISEASVVKTTDRHWTIVWQKPDPDRP